MSKLLILNKRIMAEPVECALKYQPVHFAFLYEEATNESLVQEKYLLLI